MRNILFWMFSRIEQKNREKDNWRKQIFKNVCITDQQILHPNLWRFRRENLISCYFGEDIFPSLTLARILICNDGHMIAQISRQVQGDSRKELSWHRKNYFPSKHPFYPQGPSASSSLPCPMSPTQNYPFIITTQEEAEGFAMLKHPTTFLV